MTFQQPYIYTTGIKAMLYSFGDCKTPLNTTTQRIEAIVKTQMRGFLSACDDVRIIRRGKDIDLEDITFVIRKDPFKLQRLLDFVEFGGVEGKLGSKIESTGSSGLKDVEIPFLKKGVLKCGWMTEVGGEDEFQLGGLAQIDKLTTEISKEGIYILQSADNPLLYIEKVESLKIS